MVWCVLEEEEGVLFLIKGKEKEKGNGTNHFLTHSLSTC